MPPMAKNVKVYLQQIFHSKTAPAKE